MVPCAHPTPVLDFQRVAENCRQVAVDFLRTEVQCGHTFASIGLSTNDESNRIRNTANARIAYNTLVRFMGRIAFNSEEAKELTDGTDSLRYKLVALGEKRWSIVGRRLEDRIHMLAAKTEGFPINSPESQEITELIKAELSEYFEREKNPAYDANARNVSAAQKPRFR